MADIDLNDPEVKKAIADAAKAEIDKANKIASDSVSGLKAKNDELLGKLKSKDTMTDEDVNELKEFRASIKKAEEDKAIKAGEFDKLKEQLITNHNLALETEVAKTTKMKQALDRVLIDGAAIEAISEAKGSTKLLLPHVKNHLKVVEQDNGDFVARVVDSQGTIIIGDKNGAPKSISQLVDEMKTDDVFVNAFIGSGANGGGAQGSKNNGTVDTSKMTSVEKIKHGLLKAANTN